MPTRIRSFVQLATSPVTVCLGLLGAIAFLSLSFSVHAGGESQEQAEEFEEFLKLSTADDPVSINLVSIRSVQNETSVAVSMTFKGTAPDFRIIAIDADGNQHKARSGGGGGGGTGSLSAVTLVSHFSMPKERIKSIVVQRAVDR